MEFADTIREKRINGRITQKSLASVIGTKEDTICSMETGRRIPTDSTVWKICAALCFDRSEVIRLLEIVREHRRNRERLQFEYAIGRARKLIDP